MKYRHAWPGFLLLFALAVLLASLLLWGDRFLTPSPAGGISRVLQSRIAWGGLQQPEPSPVDAAIASVPGEASSAGSKEVEVPSSRAATSEDTTAPDRESPPGWAPPEATRARYALDLGTFAADRDAERAETQLNQAGFSTVRFRQQTASRLFRVSVRRPPDTEPPGPVSEQPGPPGSLTAKPDDRPQVPIARALPLRSAVELAEKLRADGYHVRIEAEADRTGQIRLRHGNFVSRQEAEAASRQVSGLGVANEVVPVK